jgi:hypothetical protein
MGIGGLWHGAAWTFVLWGLFHGLCLGLNHLWQEFWAPGRRRWPLPPWLTRSAGTVLTFFLVVLGWVLFRAVGLKAAGQILGAMFGLGAGPVAGSPALLKGKEWIWLAGLLAFVWLLPNAAQLVRDQQPYPAILKDGWSPRRAWQRWRISPAWAYFTALLLAAAVLSLSRAGEFLYYNF